MLERQLFSIIPAMRPSQRQPDELRPITIARHYTKYAEGSVLVAFGDTKVLCTASIVPGIPRFLKETKPKQGWLTAEYGMLPRATHARTEREAAHGKQKGRTVEIQRLIGRSLRQAIDLQAIGENTITIDCDVIQADGGTRTAAITGASVALADALYFLKQNQSLQTDPFKHFVAAISVGIYQGVPILDLDYQEDSHAETDMNIVMTDANGFIEIQGTAEAKPFQINHLTELLELARKGIATLIQKQRETLAFLQER